MKTLSILFIVALVLSSCSTDVNTNAPRPALPTEIGGIRYVISLRADAKWNFDVYLFESVCYVIKTRYMSEYKPIAYKVDNIEEGMSLLKQLEKVPGIRPPFEPDGFPLAIHSFDRKSHALRSTRYLGRDDDAETQSKLNVWIERQIAGKRPAKLDASALESLIPSNW